MEEGVVLKRYAVEGIERVLDAFDDPAGEYTMSPVEVVADSEETARELASSIFYSVVEQERKGQWSHGWFTPEVTSVREIQIVGRVVSLAQDLPPQIPLPVTAATIEICNHINRALLERFTTNPNELQRIRPRLLEELLADIFRRLDCDVELTKPTRDGGRDIIAVRNNLISERFLIECKRRDRVGIGSVRELYGVKMHEGATKAILATTGLFTPPANQFIRQHIWELEGRDRDGILDWIRLCLQRSD